MQDKTRAIGGLVTMAMMLFGALPVGAQPPGLVYSDRGRYKEGIRPSPATTVALDLVGAQLDYQEAQQAWPASYRALFYLPSAEPVYFTIRESNPRYYYWLDSVAPAGWRAGDWNRFDWPTATVIQSLNWLGDLKLGELAVVARLRKPVPDDIKEDVAPVGLYHTRPPEVADRYRFVFRPTAQMRLAFEVFSEARNNSLAKQTFPFAPAERPLPVMWNAGQWADGWYRLVVEGETNTKVKLSKVVRFYHSRQLGK